MITLGGDAELEYVDNSNPFSEGIVFSVRPPRKSWKAIQNLSGGEKTLSSLALVFALHHFKVCVNFILPIRAEFTSRFHQPYLAHLRPSYSRTYLSATQYLTL